ncbi:hypothetical protein pEaSNUABM29_00109 [Erwinia phage pEa_SNUABM_29]|nr:hypothetical protein pEaSNUABM29_00109 [Erwinia phage pEa_SNUABM_29]
MFENDPNFNVAEKLIKNYMAKLAQNPVLTHDDELIHETLHACAVVLPYFKLLAAESVQQVLYDEYPQVGFTFNTFYNETAQFLLDGKRRTMSTGQWSVLLVSYMNDIHSTKQVEQTGSLGSRLLAAAYGRSGSVRSMGKAHQTLKADNRLLSYADHELLARWMTRPNGLSDMISSLAVFLKIARP